MRVSLALLFLLLPGLARAGIDFTPTQGERVLEGITFKQTIFHQDGRAISYEPPRGWTLTGDAAGVKLTPNVGQAQAAIEQSPLSAPQPLDEAVMAQMQKRVLESVPNGSVSVILVSEERNPIQINQQPTYAATVAYNFYGEDYQMSVLFANLPATQLRFRTTARKAIFEDVRRAFRASLYTLIWQ